MSGLLVQMFLEKYPPHGKNKTDQVETYPPYDESYMGIEDIFLMPKHKKFAGLQIPLITEEAIRELASKIFDDITYDFFYDVKDGCEIYFTSPDDYNDVYLHSYHQQHIFVFWPPLKFRTIKFSTGHSGSSDLHEKQREKYFQFANGIYDIFMENALSLEKENMIN